MCRPRTPNVLGRPLAGRPVDPATWLIVAIIAVAVLTVVVLPMRKRWNAEGDADEARRQALERDLVASEDE